MTLVSLRVPVWESGAVQGSPHAFSSPSPAVMSAVAAHRYRHLYPPTALFKRNDECKQADSGQCAAEQRSQLRACGVSACAATDDARAFVPADHESNYALIWSIVHGARTARTSDADAQSSAQAATPAHTSPAAPTRAKLERRHGDAAHQQTPSSAAASAVPATAVASAAAPSAAIAAVKPATAATAATIKPPAVAEVGIYTREQLLALYRPSGMPDVLQARLDPSAAASASPVDAWLTTCISSESLAPLALSVTPHPAEAALRAELARDAEMTGVAEYAHEWWLPNYSDMNNAAGGGGGGRRGGRGGGNQHNKRGRGGGGGGGRGGRGGYQNNNNWGAAASHSNKKKPQQPQSTSSAAAAAESNTAEATQSMDFESSGATAAAAPSVAASAPALGAGFGLGAGRKPKGGKKRAHDESVEPAKNLYAQTNISRLFIGPAGPPAIGGAASAAAAAPASTAAQLAAALQFVLPSGSPPAKAASPAAIAATSAPNVASSPPPLPSKESVFAAVAASQSSDSGSDPVANEMMRNIMRHQQEQQQKKQKTETTTDGDAQTKE